MKRPDKTLKPDVLWKKIDKSMKRYSKFNFLENYAIFMGKAQLLEFSLKKILIRRYRYGERKLERMTLGRAIAELERLGMRKDFVSQLRQLNSHRIKMAHEFLTDFLHLVSLDRRFGRLLVRPLNHALWTVEETIHVFDHLNQNKMLYKRQRIAY
jgi:hypothetical protein